MKTAFLTFVFFFTFVGMSFAQPESGTIWLTIYARDYCTPTNVPSGHFCYIQLGEGEPASGRISPTGYFSVSYKDPPNVEWTSYVAAEGWIYIDPANGYKTTDLNTSLHVHLLEGDFGLMSEE